MPGIGFAVEMRARRAICSAFALAGLLALPACGGEDHVNHDRPPASITVTASIIDGHIHVSPERFGAGPIRLIVTNQTDAAQTITFETDEVGGDSPGITRKTAPIDPSDTTTLEADVREGDYAISTGDDGIRPATVQVGAERPSAQNDLLLP
jgi:hypothetical protein